MSLSRRAFVKTLGVGGASVAVFAGRAPGALAELWSESLPAAASPILLHNNENPVGPGEAVIEAVRATLGNGARAGRYPRGGELTEAIARRYGVSADHVMIGNGSTQLLRTATQVFTSESKPLVAGSLTYEECAGYAELVGHPVVTVPLDAELRLDLDAMAAAAKGASLVFLCNPNNPTATIHSADAVAGFVDRVLAASPDTMILIDEAYHDYVTDPSHKSQIPLAVENKRVIVARTFSKAHGMAGMRMGYVIGQPETLEAMSRRHYGNSVNVLAMAGATASIQDEVRIERERERNTEARKFTLDWFKARGFGATDSQTNFIFVETGRPARELREGCEANGVRVGRDFPPFEKTHARISIGTLEEMHRATEVFGEVLGASAAALAA